GVERLWKTVGERVIEILNGEEHFPHTVSYPKELFFIIQSNWDVFTNMGTGEPWWILGNMRRDSLQDIVDNFERTKSIGLRVIYNVSLKDLAKQYGDPSSRLINGGVENLWLADYCEQQMAERR
ncbi:MAG: hypothetical protein Q7N50_10295, partial [Armatimonadota bacterium]|nr:hypothetical protein [Armatimonadota bacterium]